MNKVQHLRNQHFQIRRAPVAPESVNLLNRKEFLRVATYNVRTASGVGELNILASIARRFETDILCVQETKIPAEKAKTCDLHAGMGYYYHWFPSSGKEPGRTHTYGTGMMLSPRAYAAMSGWKAVNDRLMSARFKYRHGSISVVCAYAPHNDRPDGEKDEFYDQLNRLLNGIPRSDIVIFGGDMNAVVGADNAGIERVMGRYGMGTRNDNGERLISLCSARRLCIMNTVFKHKDIHRLSFYSNLGYSRMLDYIMCSQRWRTSCCDTKVFRNADAPAAAGSDHRLVIAKFKLRLSSTRETRRQPQLDINMLKSPAVLARYQHTLEHRLANSMRGRDVESRWHGLSDAVIHSAAATIPATRRPRNDWISDTTRQLVDAKTTAFRQITDAASKAEYRRLGNAVKRQVLVDKDAYWTRIANELNQDFENKNLSGIFGTLRQLSGKRAPAPELVKDANGNQISETTEKVEAFRTYFNNLLVRPPPTRLDAGLENGPPAGADLDAETISRAEVSRAISRMKSNKAPGDDAIRAELLKSGGPALEEALFTLIEQCWREECAPEQWKDAVIVPVYKKGDRALVTNYRGISLLSIAGKVFAYAIQSKFLAWRDARTREEQAGFRPGRGTAEQIFALRQVLDVRHRFQRPTYAVFVDFTAAFDSVHRESLWKIMAHAGTPGKLIRLLQALYSGSRSCVKVFKQKSAYFDIDSGVRQGCIVSPTLFNYAVDHVMLKAAAETPGIQVGRNMWMTDLDYADDLVIFAESEAEAQRYLDRLSDEAGKIGLLISEKKTKVLGICVPRPPVITLRNHIIDTVDSFCYLGSTVTTDTSCGEEVNIRIGKANAAFDMLQECLWSQRDVSKRVKIKVFEMAIIPVLLYGGESWPIRVKDLEKVEAFAMRCIRRIAGVRWNDFVRNEVVRARCGVSWTVESALRKRRLKFAGHVVRMADTRWARRLMEAGIRGQPPVGWKRRQGGQRRDFLRDTLGADLLSIGSSRDRLFRDGLDRTKWARRVENIQ